MDWRDQMISDVGHGMGIEQLDFSGSGIIKFEFERRGVMYVEAQEDGVLLYLIRKISHHECVDMFTKALKLCHFSQAMKFPLQVGLQGDEDLFLCSFLVNESFSRPNIEAVMQMMGDQFDRLTLM